MRDTGVTTTCLLSARDKLVEKCPAVAAIIRQRFPAIFIDEMQDTSEMQNALLPPSRPNLSTSAEVRGLKPSHL